MQNQIIASHLNFPEGPAFDRHKSLWCVEQKGGSLFCINELGSNRIEVGGIPNGIAIDANQSIWFCDSGQNSIRLYNPEADTTETILNSLEGMPLNMPNDLAFDKEGNLVFTCPGAELSNENGYICVYNYKKQLYKISTSLYYPNGLAFTKDGKRLLVAETGKKRIWIGNWDSKNANWTNTRIFANTGGVIGPDGMAIDEKGFLYVAIFGSGCIRVFDLEGQHFKDLPTPGMNPTNCAFDPYGQWGLVVTETETGTLLSLPVNKKGIL